jgi:hypothetical protein
LRRTCEAAGLTRYENYDWQMLPRFNPKVNSSANIDEFLTSLSTLRYRTRTFATRKRVENTHPGAKTFDGNARSRAFSQNNQFC